MSDENNLKIRIESQILAAKIASQVMKEDGVDIRQDLEQAFYEAFTEQGMSEEKFWASLDDDDDSEIG